MTKTIVFLAFTGEKNWLIRAFHPYFKKETELNFIIVSSIEDIFEKDGELYCRGKNVGGKAQSEDIYRMDYVVPAFHEIYKKVENKKPYPEPMIEDIPDLVQVSRDSPWVLPRYKVRDDNLRKALRIDKEVSYQELFSKIKMFLNGKKMLYSSPEVTRICASKVKTELTLVEKNDRVARPKTFVIKRREVPKYTVILTERYGYKAVVIKFPYGSMGAGILAGSMVRAKSGEKTFGGSIVRAFGVPETVERAKKGIDTEGIIMQGIPNNQLLIQGYPVSIRAVVHPIIKGGRYEGAILLWVKPQVSNQKKNQSEWSGYWFHGTNPQTKRDLIEKMRLKEWLGTNPTLEKVFGTRSAEHIREQIEKICNQVIKAVFQKAGEQAGGKKINAEVFSFDFLPVSKKKQIRPLFLEINTRPGDFNFKENRNLVENFSKLVVPDILRKVKEEWYN